MPSDVTASFPPSASAGAQPSVNTSGLPGMFYGGLFGAAFSAIAAVFFFIGVPPAVHAPAKKVAAAPPPAAAKPVPVPAVAAAIEAPSAKPEPKLETVAAVTPAAPAAVAPKALPDPQAAVPAPAVAAMPAAVVEPAPAPPVVEPELVTLSGGSFRMGSAREPSERPVHAVQVGPFAIARHAVTNAEWAACVADKACPDAGPGAADAPVVNISWADATAYAAWLSKATGHAYRLPTEPEWEYAARAGATTRYPWGDAMIEGRASCKGCGTPVDPAAPPRATEYPPNAYGLYAMGGGVEEWVQDCWHPDYAGAPARGARPWGAAACTEHVLRGGSWLSPARDITIASRASESTERDPTHGFRLAR